MKSLGSILLSTLVLALVGLASFALQEPWLVPSLGSAVFVQTLSPREASGALWNTIIGQVAGLLGGFLGVYLAGAAQLPAFTEAHHLALPRLGAVAVSIAVSVALQLSLKASSPAGGATALIVALGLTPSSWAGAARLLIGILLAGLLGEGARHLLLRLEKSPE